jgi:hypothetical protein
MNNDQLKRQYTCKHCGHLIGELRDINGMDYLVINGVLVSYMRGLCICGKPVSYAISDQVLEKLLKCMVKK